MLGDMTRTQKGRSEAELRNDLIQRLHTDHLSPFFPCMELSFNTERPFSTQKNNSMDHFKCTNGIPNQKYRGVKKKK